MRAWRVLIVDDNVGLAENIAEILEIDGHTTVVAASAAGTLNGLGTGSLTDANGPFTLVGWRVVL